MAWRASTALHLRLLPQRSLRRAGACFWNLDHEPVWIDSASDGSLRVLAGLIDSDDQALPVEERARVGAIVEAEIARR